MSLATGIQWTDATWNPVTGCTRVSPGCARCYIERTPPFRMQGRIFARVGNVETTGVRLHAARLEQPLRWRKPRRVFVCSLADLFHEEVPDHFVAGVFAIMSQASQHVFQVLTKRPERARDLLRRHGWPVEGYPNVWLGVSIENARYTWRADVLREIPAAIRFVSAEPLLGSLFEEGTNRYRRRVREASLAVVEGFIEDGMRGDDASAYLRQVESQLPNRSTHPLDLTGIDWLIAGGESGPGARGCDLAWIRELRGACLSAGTAFFVKQLGSNAYEHLRRDLPHLKFACEIRDRKGGDIDEWPADLRIREFPDSRNRESIPPKEATS